MEITDKNKNRKISITKLPKYLSNCILNFKKEIEIGEIIVNNEGEIFFHVSDKIDSSIPLDYNVKQVDRKLSDMCVISSVQNASFFEGTVESELLMTPIINKRYLQFKKCMTSKTESSTEVIDSLGEGFRMEKLGNLREMDFLARKRKQMLIDKKRERLDKSEVMNIIFNAFEKYESWTVRDLADFTGQPTAFIQEIVNDICNVDKKDHKSSYSLKDEYK